MIDQREGDLEAVGRCSDSRSNRRYGLGFLSRQFEGNFPEVIVLGLVQGEFPLLNFYKTCLYYTFVFKRPL